MEIKNTIAIGNKGKMYQIVRAWILTISVKFREPDIRIIGSKTRLIATS
jgi:hypothetical protein